MSQTHHNRFYVPPAEMTGETFAINREELHHFKVRRLKPKDILYAVDGIGGEYKGEVHSVLRDFAVCKILEKRIIPPPKVKITLGLGIIRPSPMAWACEKSAELGCWEIVPVKCENSSTSLAQSEIERLNRLTLSAMKQSGRAYHTKVEKPCQLSELLRSHKEHCRIIFADPSGVSISESGIRNPKFLGDSSVLYLVGPEGGFSGVEINMLREAGAFATSFGQYRLRSETAAVAGITLLAEESGYL
jgi:16S rRNA (uracil1498-N3)-methyltransferase